MATSDAGAGAAESSHAAAGTAATGAAAAFCLGPPGPGGECALRVCLDRRLAAKAFAADSGTERRESVWLLDSAAFPSMTPFLCDFDEGTLRVLSSPVIVEAAGGESIEATHSGSAVIRTTVDERNCDVTVENVLFVPKLVFRLLSTSILDGTYGCFLSQWQGEYRVFAPFEGEMFWSYSPSVQPLESYFTLRTLSLHCLVVLVMIHL